MSNQPDLIEKLESMIAERRQEVVRLQTVHDEIMHLEATLAILQEADDGTSEVIGDIASMTQMGALISIAKNNNGIMRVQPAKRLLLRAGKIKNPKNANSVMYTLLRRSETFDRVSPGVYKLRGWLDAAGKSLPPSQARGEPLVGDDDDDDEPQIPYLLRKTR